MTMTLTDAWDEITVLVLRAQAGDRVAYGELVVRFQGSGPGASHARSSSRVT